MLVRMVSMAPIMLGLFLLQGYWSMSKMMSMKFRFLSSTKMSKSSAAPATAVKVWKHPNTLCLTASLSVCVSWLILYVCQTFYSLTWLAWKMRWTAWEGLTLLCPVKARKVRRLPALLVHLKSPQGSSKACPLCSSFWIDVPHRSYRVFE